MDQFGDQFLGLARGGAVADGDERDVVAVDHLFEGGQRADPVVLRLVRVDGAGIEQFAGGVHHGHFGAGAEAGVETEHGLAGQRRLAEQGAQVGGKDVDGVAVGLFAQFTAHIALDGGQQQPLGGIFDGQAQLVGEGRKDILLELGCDGVAPVALVDLHAHLEDAFLLAAVEGQDLVRLEAVDAAFEGVIRLVDAFLVHRILDLFGDHFGELERLFAGCAERTLALSLIVSATMSRAPCRASSTVVTCSLRYDSLTMSSRLR